MLKTFTAALVLVSAICFSASAAANYGERDDVQTFINEMVTKYQYDRNQLTIWMEAVVPQTGILETIARPAESKSWKEYRPIFITNERIQKGIEFWKANSEIIGRAEQHFGVPAEIIVAIIGVETFYGKRSGNFLVLDALATLGFDYPPRAAFFRKELEQYLLMVREEKIDPREMRGSYAGAMGMPQFIPSSYRNFSVDFDSDGKRDLWNNTADVVGSVANYFKMNGWRTGEPVISRASVPGDVASLVSAQIKPNKPVSEFKQQGVTPIYAFSEKAQAVLLQFEGVDGAEYWMGLENFYVITRYNRSPLYALAVFQLSQALFTEYNTVQ
jgi:membrane-bound lytic murein transglycosylase B